MAQPKTARRPPLKDRKDQEEPVLDLEDIQGNILPGFNKDHQALLFVRFVQIDAAKRYLRALLPYVASSAEVLAYTRLRARIKRRRNRGASGLSATWLNVAFTASGLSKLTSKSEVARFVDAGFRNGMVATAGLGDPEDASDPGHPSQWSIGGSDATTPDMLLILAADSIDELRSECSKRKQEIAALQGALVLMTDELEGHALPSLRGLPSNREHFGFRDGISQPGVRGRASSAADDFIAERTTDPKRFGKPGQPLVWPGEFLIGLPRQSDVDATAPAEARKPSPSWTKHGSYLVFRQLHQDVAGFQRALRDEAKRLAALGGFGALDAERLGAMLVGRWRSGAPVMRTPAVDNPALALDELANNDFNFREDTPAGETSFPAAKADPDGVVCPLGSHLRKVNPRDDPTEQGGPRDTLTRRILRRGIPYGKPLRGEHEHDDGAQRGLLFLSYQASIVNQFQFLMSQWVTAADKPQAQGGTDPLLADQTNGAVRVVGANGKAVPVEMRRFVSPRAGLYCFAPSISALRDPLSRT